MKKEKWIRYREWTRIVALVLIVVMLPFADFEQAFAKEQSLADGLDTQQTVVSTNTIEEDAENSTGEQGQDKTEDVEIKEERMEEDDGEETDKTSETLPAAGTENDSAKVWERITQKEVEQIRLADASQYEDLSTGCHDLIYEPKQGISVGASSFGKGMVKGVSSLTQKATCIGVFIIFPTICYTISLQL